MYKDITSRVNALPVKEIPTPIHKGATRTKSYRELNPLGKVPLLEAGALRLPESGAILTYLAQTCLDRRAGESGLPWPVISALHWFHNSIRTGSTQLVFNLGAIPLGQQVDQAAAKKALALLKQSLETLQDFWLRDGPFIAAQPQPSIADMQVACELEQLVLLNKVKHGIAMEEILEPYPKVQSWMVAVAKATAPHYNNVHAIVRKVAALNGGSKSPTILVHPLSTSSKM